LPRATQHPHHAERQPTRRTAPRGLRAGTSGRRAAALRRRLAALACQSPPLSPLQPGQPAAHRHAEARRIARGRVSRLAALGLLRARGGARHPHLVPAPAVQAAAAVMEGRRRRSRAAAPHVLSPRAGLRPFAGH
jgi:hypothetical protein